MHDLELSGLFIAPLARCILDWLDAGKIGDEDLDRVLTSNARAILDSGSEAIDWIPLEDVEALVAIVAEQLGSGAGLVDWAETVIDDWGSDSALAPILANASSLVDSAGYVVTQTSERLVRDADWSYEGGRVQFSVRIMGLESASPDLKTLLGALLTRIAQGVDDGFDDLRFEGVDDEKLCIFGERSNPGRLDEYSESRLHRAALIG